MSTVQLVQVGDELVRGVILRCCSVARFVDLLLDSFRRIGGIAAAMLPVRLWPELDEYLPVSSSAFLAGLLTFLAAAAIGIPGFLNHAAEQASLNTAANPSPSARSKASSKAAESTWRNSDDWPEETQHHSSAVEVGNGCDER